MKLSTFKLLPLLGLVLATGCTGGGSSEKEDKYYPNSKLAYTKLVFSTDIAPVTTSLIESYEQFQTFRETYQLDTANIYAKPAIASLDEIYTPSSFSEFKLYPYVLSGQSSSVSVVVSKYTLKKDILEITPKKVVPILLTTDRVTLLTLFQVPLETKTVITYDLK
jgi:hypothetical protein